MNREMTLNQATMREACLLRWQSEPELAAPGCCRSAPAISREWR